MEYIYIAAAIVVAFFCMFFYKRGVRDGVKMAERLPFEPIMEKPSILMTKEEKQQAKEDKAAAELEKTLQEEVNEIFTYSPKHIAKRSEQD